MKKQNISNIHKYILCSKKVQKYMSIYCSMHMCRLTRPLCILVPHVLPAYAFQKAFMTQKWGIAFLALKHSASSDWFDKNVCLSILFNKVNSFFEYKPKTRLTLTRTRTYFRKGISHIIYLVTYVVRTYLSTAILICILP